MGRDGCIYGVAQNACGVLRIDPFNATAEIIGDLKPGGNKWHGGLADHLGNIWGVPANADSILKINTVTREVECVAEGKFASGEHRSDGKYERAKRAKRARGSRCEWPKLTPPSPALPPIPPFSTSLRSPRFAHLARTQRYKFLGGVLGVDKNIYLLPCDSDYVCRINPETNEVKDVGPNLRGEMYERARSDCE